MLAEAYSSQNIFSCLKIYCSQSQVRLENSSPAIQVETYSYLAWTVRAYPTFRPSYTLPCRVRPTHRCYAVVFILLQSGISSAVHAAVNFTALYYCV